MRIVDLRREGGYPLSAPLLAELGRVADEGGKAVPPPEPRGVAPALHCRACGVTPRCDHCDVALTLHADRRLHCHHSGLVRTRRCPACSSAELARLGAGTEKLEAEPRRRLPSSSSCGSTPTPSRTRRGWARSSTASAKRPRRAPRYADGREGPPLRGRRARRRRRRRHGDSASRTSARRSGRSSSSPSSPGGAGATPPGRVLLRTYQPDSRPIALAARHAVEEFLAGELARRGSSAIRYRHPRPRSRSPGPLPDGARRVLTEVRRELPSASRASSSSARRRSSASGDATAPSSWQRPRTPAACPAPPRGECSPRPLRRCAATASPRWSTSTRKPWRGLTWDRVPPRKALRHSAPAAGLRSAQG